MGKKVRVFFKCQMLRLGIWVVDVGDVNRRNCLIHS